MQNEAAPLWQWDAVDLAALVRTGGASCREVVSASLARLDAVNPAINAVVQTFHEEALADADRADKARRGGAALGPLHGVPFTIKVNTDQAGHATTNGVVAYKNAVVSEDSAVVTNLRRAGAIIIGCTNTPCYSMRWFTDNDLHGKTSNPWNAQHTPGGSSGGAGSAIAAGIGAIAQGNDIAGSVRYPAFCCGVAGLRLGFEAMAQPHHGDPRCIPVGAFPPSARPLRAAIVVDPGGMGVHPAIADAIRCAAAALEQAGYIVEEIEPPELIHTAELWEKLAMPDTIARLEPMVEANGDEGVKRGLAFWRAAWSERDPASSLAALSERYRLLRLWNEFFIRYPILILPVSTQPPFEWDEDIRDAETAHAIIEAQRAMLAISVLGLPGLCVPTGLSNGLPTGVQIVAAPCCEDLCFDAAEIIERACPMPTPIDPR